MIVRQCNKGSQHRTLRIGSAWLHILRATESGSLPKAGLRICLTFILIQVQLFTSMRMRILIVIKVMRICDHWSTEPPGLLNCKRPRPSKAPFEPLQLLNLNLMKIRIWIKNFTLMRIPIQLPKIMRIRNTGLL